MKQCYGVLGCVIVLSSLALGAVPAEDASSKDFSSPSAQAAQKTYMQALEKAWQQYQVLADKAVQDYRLALQTAYKKEVEADNLKEALSIKEEIQWFSFDHKKGLVLYFPFDKPAVGSKTPDMSDSNNNGKVKGPVWLPEGAVGGSYHFDVSRKTDRIVVADSNSLDCKQITISVWIKTNDNDDYWNRIIDKNWKLGFSLSTGGDARGKQYRGKVYFSAGENHGIESDNVVSDVKWHHVVARYDGETMTMYIDGLKQRSQHKMSTGIPLNNYNIGIGNSYPEYNATDVMAFNGFIDELRVYNRPLSDKEIAALYGQRK
jgi:hypothetical protein